MPTKLAEFLATGVRPVQFGCNEEVSAWVRRTGSGLVLDEVSAAGLGRAADAIISTAPDAQVAEVAGMPADQVEQFFGIKLHDKYEDAVAAYAEAAKS